MKRLVFIAVSLIFSINVNAQDVKNVKIISSKKLERKINKNIQLVDVRTPNEFVEGHIGNAVNFNVLADDFVKNAEILDKNKIVYVYCKSGKRSASAAKKLSEAGFKKIRDLKGGYLSWQEFKAQK